MAYRLSTDFMNGAVTRVLLLFDRPSYMYFISHCLRQGQIWLRVARWLNGRALDSGVRGRGFETYLRCVVSLIKTLYSPKVLVILRKRWLRPDMTEKLLTGMLSLNTNKQSLVAYLFEWEKLATNDQINRRFMF